MPTVEDILKTAIGEVGITEYPPNSNNVKYNTAFYGTAEAAYHRIAEQKSAYRKICDEH